MYLSFTPLVLSEKAENLFVIKFLGIKCTVYSKAVFATHIANQKFSQVTFLRNYHSLRVQHILTTQKSLKFYIL